MNMKYALVGVAFFFSVDAYASVDPLVRLQEMVNDLGGNMNRISDNNGKTLNCAQGGTKKISIKFGENASSYYAYYDRCRENDEFRDVIYEIETIDEEVVKNEAKPTLNRELFDAVMSNDAPLVKSFLKKKANVNVTYTMPIVAGGEIERWTPLMSAASNGNVTMSRILIKAGAWVNYLNGQVKNALWYAVNSGKTDVVKYLLEQGAYVNNSDIANTTPLMVAAMNGDADIVKLLVSHKANLDMRHNDGDTALMFAIAHGHSKIASLLIHAGANLNISNKSGVTALIICAVENNIEVAKSLISKKVNVEAKTDFGKTALDIAMAKGHTQLAQLLAQAATSKNTVKK